MGHLIRWRFYPLVLAGLLVFPTHAPGQPSRQSAALALQQMRSDSGVPVEASYSPVSGVVSFLSLQSDQPLFISSPAGTSAEGRARMFLDQWGRLFGIGGADEMRLIRSTPPEIVGMEHVRFQQTHRSVPITGAELTAHLRGDGIVAVNAKTLPDLGAVQVVPLLSADGAIESVRRELEDTLRIADADLSEPRLELLNRGLLERRATETRLSWFVTATRADLREFIWIDAEHGRPLLWFSQLADARFRAVFDADDPSDGTFGELPGELVRLEGEAATGDPDVDAAYDFSGGTYDYFKQQHGLDSYNGTGAPLISTVHYCLNSGDCPYENAFWNGEQMVFGEGYSLSDDVVAHELTHAVTEYSAGLFYYMQSGALNESYSDIFGETIDRTYTGGMDLPNGLRSAGTCSQYTSGTSGDNSYRWIVGEDLPDRAIRDMWHPPCLESPGKVSDPEFVCATYDMGGVHYNSGVPNHAYALMVDGGEYNGQSVKGITLYKAGRVQYRALAHYLTSASDFLDNYNAVNQACRDLIGTALITASDCEEVDKALLAVEMQDPWPCDSPHPQPNVPSLCPFGQSPNLWHSWDVESSTLSACPADSFPDDWCLNGPTSVWGPFATSGVHSYWGFAPSTVSDLSLPLWTTGTLPSNARMQFNHSHGFQNAGTVYYDGGVVEYTTDALGYVFADGGPLIQAGQPYRGILSSSYSNPLGGRAAFVAESWGYTATQLDLSSLAGQTFLYRFRVGTDSLINGIGWFIDDIRIYSCAACESHRVLDETYNGLATYYGASGSVEAGAGYKVGPSEHVLLMAPTVRLGDDFEAWGGLTVSNFTCQTP